MSRSRRSASIAVRQVLVRHAESPANAAARFQGQTDTGLTVRGHEQARRLATHLVGALPVPCQVVTSDLGRVVDTAAPYLATTGLRPHWERRLRELDTGSWSGRSFTEVAREFPREMAAIAAGADVRRGGDGETFAELRRRVSEALDEAAREAADEDTDETVTTVVFTHGGPIRVAVADALGLPEGGHHLLAPPPHCSVTVITRHLDRSGGVASVDLLSYGAPTVATVTPQAE